jgi:hypothetical protein
MTLKYYFGGVDVMESFLVLAWITLVSLAALAMCIALSPSSWFWRGLFVLPLGCLMAALLEDSSRRGFAQFFGSGPSGWLLVSSFVWSGLFFLVLAAAKVSAVAENYRSWLRVTLLAAIGAQAVGVTLLPGNPDDQIAWCALLLPILALGLGEAVLEDTSELPSIYAPWVRRGWLGRIMGKFFYPGPATALLLIVLLALGVNGKIWMYDSLLMDGDDKLRALVASVHTSMAVLTPILLVRLCPKWWTRGAILLGYLGLSFSWLWWVDATYDPYPNREPVILAELSAFNPISGLFWALDRGTEPDLMEIHWPIAQLLYALELVVLIYVLRGDFRLVRKMEQEALVSLAFGSEAEVRG